MAEITWDSLSAHDVEPIVAAWETMGERRQHFQVILHDVNELADPKGMKVLLEELTFRSPDKLPEFQKMKSAADKALWAHLEASDAFDQAAIFARAEALRNGQFAKRWNGLPKEPLVWSPEKQSKLEEVVRDYYWEKELRGGVCKVNHYTRAGGAEYFFAYLPNWPEKQLIFDSDQNLTPREETYAFHNVFVFLPSEGCIELIAKGGKQVQLRLRQAFCQAALDVEVADDEPIRASYKLDQLLDPGFGFETQPEDMLAAVRLRRIRIVPRVGVLPIEYLELKFSESASRSETLAVINSHLAAHRLNLSQVSVPQASIQLQFLGDGEKKGKKLTINVSYPNTSDLKSKPDDVRIVAERCIRRWGILHD
jgi:hypothetical protein